MLTLHPTKQQYHVYKDQALLEHVLSNLTSMTDQKGTNNTTIMVIVLLNIDTFQIPKS